MKIKHCVFFLLFSFSTFAKIPTELEADFAQAILSVNDQDYSSSLQILDKLIQASPGTLEFLELKANVFKESKQPLKTAEVYKDIIQVQKEAKKQFIEIAPYYFELGLVYFEQQQLQDAITNFRTSARSPTHAGISFFYLGMSYFNIENFFTAEKAFIRVLRSDQNTLFPVAHFYLGQIYFKRKNTSIALEQMAQAQEKAAEILKSKEEPESTKKIALQIYEATKSTLEPINKPRFFANAGLRGEYDSNILALPDKTIENTTTGVSSYKYTLSAGGGYISPPLSFVQIIPSYRFSMNLNSNEKARVYEYVTNTLSLYINRKPLNPLTYGFKFLGVHTFENLGNLTTRFDFEPYSLEGEFGPYIKIPLTSYLDLGLEYNLSIIRYKSLGSDHNDGSSGKNATAHKPQFNLKLKTDSPYLNPNFTAQYRFNLARGSQNVTRSYSFNFDNEMTLLPKLKAFLGFNVSHTQYFKRLPTKRGDRLYGTSLSFNYNLLSNLSVNLGGRWNKNSSNLTEQFSYNKHIIYLGTNYQF